MADDDLTYLSSLSANRNRAGDTSNFNPAWASALAATLRDANNQGLHVGLASGYRLPTQTGSSFDASGRSLHSYGLASDISGFTPGSPEAHKFYEIAQSHGIYNPYGPDNKAEYNHYQAVPYELSQSQAAPLIKAAATGDWNNVITAGNTLMSAGGGGSSGGAGASGSYSSQPSRPGTPTPGPLMFAGVNPSARGMRNNNPGNLVASSWVQGLPGYKGTDGKFAIFDTPQNGAAALDANLKSYGGKGINTPLGIASTWAPASDNNNPNSYGAQIAKALGVGPNDKIDMSDPSIRAKVASAIGMVENGPGNSAGFRTAYAGTADPPATPGTTINSSPVAAAAPGAAPAPGGLAGGLKSATDAMKPFTNNSPTQQPPAFNLQPAMGSGSAGGPMMLGPGGQNVTGQRIAQQDLAQRMAQWGMSSPPIAGASSFTPTMGMQPTPQQAQMQQPGQATGMPSMPGTTLNSPSQLQMAMMTGSLDPYSMYARPPGS